MKTIIWSFRHGPPTHRLLRACLLVLLGRYANLLEAQGKGEAAGHVFDLMDAITWGCCRKFRLE